MDDSLYFTDQHHAVREMVRAFAQTAVAPVAARLDEDAKFPWENVRRMGELGLRASDTAELIFEDVEVPAENLLGEEGLGFINFMRTLDSGRIGIAALSLGLAEGALEEALRYAGVRRQFGHAI